MEGGTDYTEAEARIGAVEDLLKNLRYTGVMRKPTKMVTLAGYHAGNSKALTRGAKKGTAKMTLKWWREAFIVHRQGDAHPLYGSQCC